MKAIIQTRYGSPDVLELREVPKPVPNDDEVLVKICAASLNSYDLHMMRADPFLVRVMGGGLTGPKNPIPGADLSGIVEAVGRNVTAFKPGDKVYGDMAEYGGGAFAEYKAASPDRLVMMSAGLSFEDAAAVPMAAITALQSLRKVGHLQAGQTVVICGASGGVGTFAVQIAKALGAHVTAICSTRNLDMARALGADEVFDYTREDFTRNGRQYDLILGVNGYHPLGDYKRSLQPGGLFVMAGGNNRQIFETLLLAPLHSLTGDRKMKLASTTLTEADLLFIGDLIESGRVHPVIDRCYPLSELPQAMRYLEQEHARGKVVISVAQPTA